ncbi:MAG TPA: chemotaxis protein CheB [Porticoccaceae bacterium]|nr:chemotaxis protein CheB [Porticoccaceae bacterium]
MKVGLVADPPSALLRRGLEALGHVVVFTAAHQAAIGPEQRAAIDLLIVAAPAAGPPVRPTLACLQLVLEVAFLERAATDFEAWKENLRRRIATARWSLGDQLGAARAERVWLLAASAGGPETVARFLSKVAPLAGTALLYAQHIDAAQLPQLQRWLADTSHWQVSVAASDGFLLEGSVVIVSPERRLRLHRERALRVSPRPWCGHYRPSIDQLAESLALTYRERAGMIVFSGLGDDGVLGSQHLREQGGTVWVQDPRSCIARAMPEAVLVRGAVDYVGTVAQLAQRLQRCAGGDRHRKDSCHAEVRG